MMFKLFQEVAFEDCRPWSRSPHSRMSHALVKALSVLLPGILTFMVLPAATHGGFLQQGWDVTFGGFEKQYTIPVGQNVVGVTGHVTFSATTVFVNGIRRSTPTTFSILEEVESTTDAFKKVVFTKTQAFNTITGNLTLGPYGPFDAKYDSVLLGKGTYTIDATLHSKLFDQAHDIATSINKEKKFTFKVVQQKDVPVPEIDATSAANAAALLITMMLAIHALRRQRVNMFYKRPG